MQPRLFWRRVFAALIDYFSVVFIVATALFVVTFGGALGDAHSRVRMGLQAFHFSSCHSGTAMSPEMAAFLGRDTVHAISYCRDQVFFYPNGDKAKVTLSQVQEGNVTMSYSVTVPIDDQGRPVSPSYPDVPLSLFLTIVGGAWWMSRWNGTTPGKDLMGLRVTPITKDAALRREVLRFLPLIGLYLIAVVRSYLPPVLPMGNIEDLWTIHFDISPTIDFVAAFTPSTIAILVALLAFLGWYYLLPLFRGDGRARYDVWLGTKVVRY